ncbi:Crp/Fnr family transcriptional regulator [Roseateles sp.]|uniref:Crp/Fnr family transcriptional regulator n=1 Tax=Roseateles sp. TaxID=1971397 RepID=UPI0025E6EA6C|nr:helix-turn-helix domain-containing protein [Roseateles sp.]MBV8033464.1 helix-turn-helix domain-containing protein [Roseateles sp.]
MQAPTSQLVAPHITRGALARPVAIDSRGDACADEGRRIADTLKLIDTVLAPKRRIVHAGEMIYRAGERFNQLHILNSGFFKLISMSCDGREQVVGLRFRGDWLGFSAISQGSYGCDAIALDTAEVWTLRYDALLQACAEHPALMVVVHEAMSREMMRDRDSLMAICTLPADARVATFLHYWAGALAVRGLRADQFSLRLTRAEIGNYLGLTLETVSRVLSRLARAELIAFNEKSRRDICIPDFPALAAYVEDRDARAGLH